ncbi:hypothetical protein CONCODRAFT_77045 [Conidiobolus coronatus NRRL 28638]|uniref:DUF4419 domain-containing protein n=1 Tax=Conidiobolus coronatus (strain ATCC 28846 / CBS 209.66 / NRRL 28638) TaxID=796925 RepID=A0A137PGB4_CONC2|nr:hypothetical protein CONCODRAFT_77045 [Conidiobolus coronatus NRRL 28638]|eukprot:KXN74032.1 hypothetical protein CONCODRAFT_77045 [Conidiobolus coronatus NRRL 28638]
MSTTIKLNYSDESIKKEPVSNYSSDSLMDRFKNHKLFAGRKIESVSNDTLISPDAYEGILSRFGSSSLNGLAEAAHIAYANHHGLTLSPDHILITILQGLSIHITQDPEKYRATVGLKHTEPNTKEEIIIVRDEFQLGNPSNDWEGTFPEFLSEISKRVDNEVSPLLLGKFSTSSPRDVAVTALTIMDVYKSYFEYGVLTRCGMPEITLKGEKEDWTLLKNRVKQILDRFDDLGFWTDHLYPILDEFIAATNENKVNEEFWKSMYKVSGGSGGPFLSGWICGLYPYISAYDYDSQKAVNMKNEHMDWKRAGRSWGGLTFNSLPNGFTSTPFTWYYLGSKLKMSFVGGLLGVSLNSQTDHVSPAVGWAVLHE